MMMTMNNALITSRDQKGIHATGLFEVAYNKAKLDEDRAQLLNEKGGEFQIGIIKLINELTMLNRYASEETSSSYTYPKEYEGPRLIGAQINALATILDLDPSHALEFTTKVLPTLTLPEGAEGWFAILSVDALASRFFPEIIDPADRYCRAVQLVLNKVGSSRTFKNYREGQITSEYLRMHARTANAMATLQESQKGDILVGAFQLGMCHRGRSVRRAREVFVSNEYGLGSLMGCSIALTHPERFVRCEELDMDLSGDEFAPDGDGQFGKAPFLGFDDGGLEFSTRDCGSRFDFYGSASGFLPQ
jgi:hypothetical protein